MDKALNYKPVTDEELEAARQRGLESSITHVHATAVSFDAVRGELTLTLRGGLKLLVPTILLQGVAGAAPELIANATLIGRGSALHWEELDADFSIQDIAAGSFGTRQWMAHLNEAGLLDAASRERQQLITQRDGAAVAMGRRGGAARTQAKAMAARENGKKGGRPRKVVA